MTASDLLARISAGTAPTILDVRSPEEFVSGHVPGALNVPFWKLLGWAPAAIPVAVDDSLVVYCEHGPRAWLAGAALRRRGHRVVFLEGHMSEWRRGGLREEK